jgi:hypothetical protein
MAKDSYHVLVKGEAGSGGLDVPDVAQVVVPARSELGAVRGPLQTADFLAVVLQRRCQVVLRQ